MKTLFLFNPENDLALACNRSNYSAPRNAMELRHSAALLPLWYSDEGDTVLADNGYDQRWLEDIRNKFSLSAAIKSDLRGEEIKQASPWGWSLNSRSQFVASGVNPHILPSEEQINNIRLNSHRRITIAILSAMQTQGLYPGEIPVELSQVDELPALVSRFKSDGIFLKSPWSSTGRGVIPSSGKTPENLLQQASGIIRRQESVMVEKAYRKVRDFAMLFSKIKGQPVRYIGLSLFDTTSQAYTGNILAPEQQLNDTLAHDIQSERIEEIRNAIIPILTNCISDDYEGYFGVDMMIVESDDGSRWIHPCVEVNLRMTMGVVAHIFRNRYLAPGVSGRFAVSFGQGREHATPVIENGRLMRGTLHIVPPGGKFTVTVTVG